MAESKINETQIKYCRKMMLILALTSIALSSLIVGIASMFIKSSFLLVIFFGLVIVLLASNYILLCMIRIWVIKPMLNEMQIEKSAYRRDELTALCRREVFEERKILYEKSSESIGVLFVDINNLKTVNDQFGHFAGDELIIKVAECIKSLRQDYSELDYFRMGGDEFLIVIKDTTEYKCHQLSATLSNRINGIVLKRAKGIKASAAIGFSYSNETLNLSKLISVADEDMYRNKELMKNEI